MKIEQIGSSDQRRVFTLQEARALLPLVYRITEQAQTVVSDLLNRLEAVKGQNLILMSEIEEKIQSEVGRWENKIKRLGGNPKGTWLADFDSGDCYYCWKFPENDIRYWHDYKNGFSGRIEIQ